MTAVEHLNISHCDQKSQVDMSPTDDNISVYFLHFASVVIGVMSAVGNVIEVRTRLKN